MKYQLMRLLEQVDAIERNGHDTALDSNNAFTMESSKEAGFTIQLYVVDDFLVASPALNVDLDASQLLGDPTVLAQSLLVDELEALHQGDELTTDFLRQSDMVNFPPVTSDATYTIAVQDNASTPAPVEVIAVDGYPTSVRL
ncbi:hypothetical protein EXIGLDRAFT_776410 [Exidia glandulosa HHB12029]|uniref:Uncharacterized protein n=1 Tax=Exidia glandulosa HHB12029 TaxID=1314781 RepID=A0A165DHA7_EXIGL|nr:hypothetical protein EXIGLDRAFT_776410 [Exidia glandulosa HHB12029]